MLFLLPLALVACATPPCPPGFTAGTLAEAYFGRNHAGREAGSDADWARFLDEAATPAFPDGLSVLDGAGQWRGRDCVVVTTASACGGF